MDLKTRDRRKDFWMKRRWNEIAALKEFEVLMADKFIEEGLTKRRIEKRKQDLIIQMRNRKQKYVDAIKRLK